MIGHALNTAIGEGDTRVTALQMALAYAAIANGGKLWLPQIVERVESPDGKVVEEFPPRVRRDLAVSAESLAIIRSGLYGVVNDSKGTAYKARSHHIEVAGKTGTAQVYRGGRVGKDDPPLPYERVDHAWFVGYAPAAKPRISFAVFVEHGGHGGAVAAPVAMEIVDNYFESVVPPEDRSPPRLARHPGNGLGRGEARLPSTISESPPDPLFVPSSPNPPAKSQPALPSGSAHKEDN
jgi:penicillin-binding protein 2